jgi:hypothetical protein
MKAVSFTKTKLERKDALRVQQLREMMETLVDHIVLELSRGPRVQKLLATQQEVEQLGIPFSSEQVAIAEVEQDVTGHKSRWDDDYLDQMIMQASESLVRQRLDNLV